MHFERTGSKRFLLAVLVFGGINFTLYYVASFIAYPCKCSNKNSSVLVRGNVCTLYLVNNQRKSSTKKCYTEFTSLDMDFLLYVRGNIKEL